MAGIQARLRALLIVLALAAVSFSVIVMTPRTAVGYSPHLPIVIQANADFTAPNGVVSGSGTPSDPYVISGWEINASATAGILIRSTSAHFVVRDVHVFTPPGPSLGEPGIYLQGVWNGLVANVTVERSNEGVRLESTVNTDVRNSTLLAGRDGIHLVGGRFADISGNLVQGNRYGINAGAGEVNITGNTAVDNWYGILQGSNPSARIEDNYVARNSVTGIDLEVSSDTSVVNNTLQGNRIGATVTLSFPSVSFEGNLIYGNYRSGMYVQQSTGLIVFHNDFIANAEQASDDAGAANRWDNGYPDGGNYWSDYGGADACSGPAQDVCPNPDGIGDTPYTIDADSADRYPLMRSATGVNLPPTASFTVAPSTGNVTTSFAVDAGASSDPQDLAGDLRVRWDWEDDGTWDTAWSTAKTAAHAYAAPGSYTIRLQVQDTGGLQANATRPVVVVDLPPVAAFTVDPSPVALGARVAFDASASADLEDPGSLLDVRWDWEGDGAWDTPWSANKTADHAYGAAGTYDVRLAVRDSAGHVSETTRSLRVLVGGPDTPPPGDFPWVILLLAIVAVCLLLLFVLWRRRKQSSTSEQPRALER